MRKIIIAILLLGAMLTTAQTKRPSVALHYSFTDFATAIDIGANGMKNAQWSKLYDMDAGYGVSYWQGIIPNIDLRAGLNYNHSVYTFPTGSYNLNGKMLTVEAAGVAKLLNENQSPVTPYLAAGVGVYGNAGKTGFYAPISFGIHANLWEEAFVFTDVSWRQSFDSRDNNSFYYQIGVGAYLTKVKKPLPVILPAVVEEPKPITGTVDIWVKDEATGQPLPEVEITLVNAQGETKSGFTDKSGKLSFPTTLKGDYSVSGKLNNIETESKNIAAAQFDESNDIGIILLHNDPRFTLVGKAVSKKGGDPEKDVQVTVENKTLASILMKRSQEDGEFKAQLEGDSDFSISGKKAGYFSNIEEVSTKGLNRSATLYVKLELEIQEAKEGQQFILNNIFFAINKADLNLAASTDLNRLVKYLEDNPSARLEIQGHTDSTGSAALNNRLSQDRANSVMSYLISKGIAASRLSAKGYGSSQPVATNATIEGRTENRRVEIKILGQ